MSVAEALHRFEFRWRYEIFRVNLQFLKLLVVVWRSYIHLNSGWIKSATQVTVVRYNSWQLRDMGTKLGNNRLSIS